MLHFKSKISKFIIAILIVAIATFTFGLFRDSIDNSIDLITKDIESGMFYFLIFYLIEITILTVVTNTIYKLQQK